MATDTKTTTISFEEHVELCRYFQFDRLKRLVTEASTDLERGSMLTATFFILHTVVKAYYLQYLADHPTPPAEISQPRNDILRRMAIIYENCGMLDRALWICDVADSY